MDPYTASPASSSDLYSDSNDQSALHVLSGRSDQVSPIYSPAIPLTTREHGELGYVRPPSSTGDPANAHLKRKREDTEGYTDGARFSSPANGCIPSPNIVQRAGSTPKIPIPADSTVMATNLPNAKRSRIQSGDHSEARVAETGRRYSLEQGSTSQSPVLPAVIWQHVFCFLPPILLGRLLRVNRAFNSFLDPAKANESMVQPLPHSIVQPLSAHAIWIASRRRFCPGNPKPLQGFQELDMWRLLRGRNCQICKESKANYFSASTDNPWDSGPGDDGVRVIWQFGIRSCGTCLRNRSEKEMALMLSADCPSFILPALPFVFLSQTNHMISVSVLRNLTPPTSLQLTKYYYKPHIEDIKRKLHKVKELGPASAEEWIKGLDHEGKERANDAGRWEQWEARGGLRKVNLRPQQKRTATPVASTTQAETNALKRDVQPLHLTLENPMQQNKLSEGYHNPAPAVMVDSAKSAQTGTSIVSAWLPPPPLTHTLPQRLYTGFPQPRPERSIREVNEAKAARRAEIERRCGALDPPILPSVLNHMESFQAACQISTALTDHAWQVLEPRLLAQRENAERREQERIHQGEVLQASHEQQRQQEAQLKQAKENLDREWDHAQTPTRNRLGLLADEIIDGHWSGGSSITKETCAKFAADVLLYVRQRFYADLAREDEMARLVGDTNRADSLAVAPSRKLILENMKWVFDMKIKPLTENFQKELFLCSGCDGNFKFYGFEGVIQHYAAKHTTALSLGSIVVHWRAEWPEHPPFHGNPSAAKAAYYAVPTPSTSTVQALSSKEPAEVVTHGTLSQSTDITTQIASSAQGASQYTNVAYGIPSNGQYQESPHTALSQQHYPGYQNPYSGPVNGLTGFSSTFQGHASQSYNGPFPTPAQSMAPQNQPRYFGPSPVSSGQSFPNHSFPSYRPSGMYQNVPAQIPALFQTQLEEMAKHAREVWFGTSGIKDLQGSVRIYVVIQHTVARFAAKYANEPSLTMFIYGLDHSALMRPVRSLNGLACKTCVAGPSANHHVQSQLPVADRRLYTLPHLLNHFRTVHAEKPHISSNGQTGFEGLVPDWKREMIELPEVHLIADLINALGMDNTKLQLIAWALPGVFPSPLPQSAHARSAGPIPIYRGDYSTSTVSGPILQSHRHPIELPPAPKKLDDTTDDEPYSRPYSILHPSSNGDQLSEPPGEDEYDPHRPAYLGKIVKPETAATHFSKHQEPLSAPQGSPHIYLYNHAYGYQEVPSLPRNSHNLQSSVRNDGLALYEQSPHQSYPSGRSSSPHQDYRSHDSRGRDRTKINGRYGGPPSGYDGATDPAEDSWQTSENYRPKDDSPVVKIEKRTASPREDDNAAELFLDALKPRVETYSHGPSIEAPPRIRKFAQARGRESPNQVLEADERYNGLAKTVHHELVPSNARMSRPNRDGAEADPLPNPIHRTEYDESYISSVVQLPEEDLRRSLRSPGGYAVQNSIRPSQLSDQPEVTEYVSGRAAGTYDGYPRSRTVHHRDRSGSPHQVAMEPTYYRARSPLTYARNEPVYRVRSPLQPRESRPQRTMSYEYPTLHGRYEYVEAQDYPEKQYRQRVQYVPVRYDEHEPLNRGHYVLTRPTEQGISAAYVRLERGYGGEQVFESNGQLYHAASRPDTVRQSRDPSVSMVQGYRY